MYFVTFSEKYGWTTLNKSNVYVLMGELLRPYPPPSSLMAVWNLKKPLSQIIWREVTKSLSSIIKVGSSNWIIVLMQNLIAWFVRVQNCPRINMVNLGPSLFYRDQNYPDNRPNPDYGSEQFCPWGMNIEHWPRFSILL